MRQGELACVGTVEAEHCEASHQAASYNELQRKRTRKNIGQLRIRSFRKMGDWERKPSIWTSEIWSEGSRNAALLSKGLVVLESEAFRSSEF